jgi:predicted O-methyltransferase YrrM
MSAGRTPLTPALIAWLDSTAVMPAPVRALHERMAGDEWEEMMTHPDLGGLLASLVAITGGHRVLEIGTFVGTSALWMADALAPGGHIDCLEVDQARADTAATHIREAGFHDQVTVHVGPALDTLSALAPGYDLAYIDADKPAYTAYLSACTRLVRPGGVIVADNVLGGGVDDDRARDLREFAERAVGDPALRTVVLPIGDGLPLRVVRAGHDGSGPDPRN